MSFQTHFHLQKMSERTLRLGMAAAVSIVTLSACNMKKEAETPEDPVSEAITEQPVEQLSAEVEKGPNCMPSNSFETYYPKNVVDGNLSTAWGRTRGSKGEFYITVPCQRLDHITVWNGNWGESGWSDNSRIRQFIIKRMDEEGEITEIGTYDLINKREAQDIFFDEDDPAFRDIETLIIELNGRYEGELFDDVYISEIEFYGCY